jgi:hypothetical protein
MTARTTATTLLDHLQEQGYEPIETLGNLGQRYDQFDLIVSGTGTVRVRVYPDDEYSADISLLDRYTALEWSATFTPGTPDPAVIAVAEAAEWQLADKRGGPVTPAQEAAA